MIPQRTKFVMHEHWAKKSGHHFDLRILKDDVLKSWAVPRAKLPGRGERILCIQVPDHPKSYYNFTGNITDVYGRGKVSIYDRGPCTILSWKKEKIGIDFKGKKIKGTYWMIKLAKSKKSWLLLRGK